jgi:hypothetical protein
MSEGSSLEISGADSSIEIEHSEDEEVTTGEGGQAAVSVQQGPGVPNTGTTTHVNASVITS